MRITPVALLLMAAAFAGCAQSPPPAVPQHGWTLDCTLGAAERSLVGATWAQDCEARASHTTGQKQEIWLAVNPTNPDNVVVGAKDLNPDLSAHCVWNGIFVTHDGGATWKDVLLGGRYADRQPTSPYYRYACNTDPMGVFTKDGTLHWVVELYNLGGENGYGPLPPDPQSGRGIFQPGWKLVLATSVDGGDTFPDDLAVTLEYGDGVALLNDYSRITYDAATDTTVTVINTYYPAAGIQTGVPGPVQPAPVPVPLAGVICSVLPYQNANAPVQAFPIQPTLRTGTANPGQLNCNAIASNGNGTLSLAAIGTTGPTGTDAAAWFATSSDDGQSFTDFTQGFTFTPIPGRFEESAYRTGTNFEMAYDQAETSAHKGRLYVLTAEAAAQGKPGDDADIYIRWSDDHGAKWSDAVKVNRDGTKSHQHMGNLAVASDGSVHVFFLDKSYDNTTHLDTVLNKTCGPHCFTDITHAVSLDGGATWASERVTTVPWNGDLGKHQEDFPFIGDYIGAGSAGDVVYGAFPDASNGVTTVVALAKVKLQP